MKNIMTIVACLSFVFSFASIASSATLTLIVNDTAEQGDVRVAVFSNQTDFENGNSFLAVNSPATLGVTKLEIEDLPVGKYGIALFQDLNENMRLDRNLFDVPTEPYGFSRNPIISFSAPQFEDFEFEFNGMPLVLTITLNRG